MGRGTDGVLSPIPFHALCIALHALNTVAVHMLLRRLLGAGAAVAAGAALFAIHPLQVEPVVWASGLKDVLCATFALGALLALVRAPEGTSAERRWAAFGGATALYTLALLTKPAAAGLPFVAFALEGVVLRRPRARVVGTFLTWVLLGIPLLWVTYHAQPVSPEVAGVPMLARPLVALDAIGFYLAKLLLPLDLAIDYGRKPYRILYDPRTFLHLALALGALAACWWAAHRNRLFLAAGLSFVGALLPVLGLVPFVFQNFSTVADRYAYLAMFGPALALAAALRSSATAVYRPVWLLLALLALRSAVQTRVWGDEPTLFSHAVDINPASYLAHANLAQVLRDAGQPAEALRHARQAEAIEPGEDSWLNLGALLAGRGQLAEGEGYFRRVLAVAPRNGKAHFNLGLIAEQHGDHAGAAAYFRAAAALDPRVSERATQQLQALGAATASRGR